MAPNDKGQLFVKGLGEGLCPSDRLLKVEVIMMKNELKRFTMTRSTLHNTRIVWFEYVNVQQIPICWRLRQLDVDSQICGCMVSNLQVSWELGFHPKLNSPLHLGDE